MIDTFLYLFDHPEKKVMPNQVSSANNQYISEVNKDIEEYLNYYCNLTNSPQFAILIKGKWGCGKSWFINQYIQKQKGKKNPVYVSLYGINDFSQLEDALFQQTHPILSSKNVTIAGKIIKGLLSKWVINFDVNSDRTLDGNIQPSVSDIIRKDWYDPTSIKDDSQYNLLVFDDLERCGIDIESILGYINTFVESEHLKVVIIADEDKINEQEPNKYKKIKEKVIGKTFEIESDLKGALTNFLNKIDNNEAREYLSKNFHIIEDFYNKGECKNLRTLNQIILDFERIFDALPEKAKSYSELVQDVLELLIVFSIEVYQGRLEAKQISTISSEKIAEEQYKLKKMNENDFKNRRENGKEEFIFTEIFAKYGYLRFSFRFEEIFPNLGWWQDFFDKGIVDQKKLEELLPNSKYFLDETTPNWIKLWHYEQLSDDDFEKLIDLVGSEYQNRDYDDLRIIKHITGLFLKFSEVGLYPKTKEDILDDAKLYINDLKDSNRLEFNSPEDEGLLGKQAYSLGFQCQEAEEFKKLCEYIKQSKNKVKIKTAPDAAKKLLKIMQTDTYEFSSMICLNEANNIEMLKEDYSDFPIFIYMSANEFVETILTLENIEIRHVFFSLKKRYAIQIKELNVEIDFLREVQKILLQEIAQRQGKLTGYLLNQANQDFLEPTIEIAAYTSPKKECYSLDHLVYLIQLTYYCYYCYCCMILENWYYALYN